jgi:hypothetical protein
MEKPVAGEALRTAEALRMLISVPGAPPALGVDNRPVDGVEGAVPGPPDMRERRDDFVSTELGRLVLAFLVSREALTSLEELMRSTSAGRDEPTDGVTAESPSRLRLPRPVDASPIRSASDRGVVGARRSCSERTGARLAFSDVAASAHFFWLASRDGCSGTVEASGEGMS